MRRRSIGPSTVSTVPSARSRASRRPGTTETQARPAASAKHPTVMTRSVRLPMPPPSPNSVATPTAPKAAAPSRSPLVHACSNPTQLVRWRSVRRPARFAARSSTDRTLGADVITGPCPGASSPRPSSPAPTAAVPPLTATSLNPKNVVFRRTNIARAAIDWPPALMPIPASARRPCSSREVRQLRDGQSEARQVVRARLRGPPPGRPPRPSRWRRPGRSRPRR